MPSIRVPQKNKIISVSAGKNLMDALIEAELPVASSCDGQGLCSKCFVTVSPIGKQTEQELKTLERNKLDSSKRLCCQIFVSENITVETTYW